LSSRFIRFLFVGGMNTAVTYAIYLLLLRWASYLAAYGIAYATGIAISYWLNSRVVFNTAPSLAGMLKFPLVYVAQYLLGSALLWLLVEQFDVSRSIAMLPVIAATVPATFVLTRWVLTGHAFRSSPDRPAN
jgi:putative flippase GtrA